MSEATFARAHINLTFCYLSLVCTGLSVGFLYRLQLWEFPCSYPAFNLFLSSGQAS